MTDRRSFLKVAGVVSAGIVFRPFLQPMLPQHNKMAFPSSFPVVFDGNASGPLLDWSKIVIVGAFPESED
jgi:hypothetical protein